MRERFDDVDSIVVHGLDGNDKIIVNHRVRADAMLLGGNGNDRLFGGGGLNLLDGGSGRDWLLGGRRDDILIGGEGKDKLFGFRGHDVLIGGLLVDDVNRVFAEWRAGTLAIDELIVEDDEERDFLWGGRGSDTFFAGLGDWAW